MAAIEQPGAFPNILLVTGSDVYGPDYRAKLRELLYRCTATASPVRKGTHDFWILYTVPGLGSGEWGFQDLARTPRKMRGIVQMGPIPDNLESGLAGHLHVLLQEVGHHWLVPSDLKFDVQGTLISMPTDAQVVQAINNETPFDGPLLLGRVNSHWSAYWQSDASPFDGLYFEKQREEDGHALWEARTFAGPILTPAGLDPLRLRGSYSDLDRIVIGTKDPSTAYASTGGAFRWLEPRFSAPHEYHAGLFVAFSQFDFVYFGFYRDHRTLGVERTNGRLVTAPLGPGYRPLAHDLNSVALRIVRRGNTYHFQARYDSPEGTPSSFPPRPGRPPQLDDDLAVLPRARSRPAFNSTKFVTVATMNVSERPRAVGVLVRKWDQAHMAELAFLNLSIFQGGGATVMKTNAVPPRLPPASTYDRLPRAQLRAHIPESGPILRTRQGRLHIVAPFHTIRNGVWIEHSHFNHWTDVDKAPKVLTRAPEGDFAVATSAKMWRTIFAPWSGGYAANRTIWGIEKSLAASTAVVSTHIAAEKQPPPPADAYRMAFMIVAENRSDITDEMIERADTIRRYWDEAFDKATESRRHSDSVLGAPPIVDPILTITPARIVFGTVPVGDISGKTLRLRNDGLCDLGVSFGASAAGPFRWPAYSAVIPSGEERVVDVEFSPASRGPAEGVLSVQSDVPGGPRSVALVGTGTLEFLPP